MKNLQPREQRLLSIAGCLIGAWAIMSFVVHPLWSKSGSLDEEIESKSQKLVALRKVLGDSEYISKEYAALEAYKGSAESETSRRAFLDAIEALSRRAQLQLSLKPRNTKKADETGIFEVEFEVQGGQSQIMSFLDALVSMQELLSVERLRIAHANTRESTLRAGLVVQRKALN